MGDMGDTFRAWKEQSKKNRKRNRLNAREVLREEGIEFKTKNNGAHIIIERKVGTIDYWPGTGLWKHRGHRSKGRGIKSLVAAVRDLDTIAGIIAEDFKQN